MPSAALLIAASSHRGVTDRGSEILWLVRDLAALGWHSHYAEHPLLDTAATESELSHEELLTGLDRHIRHRLPHGRRRNAKVHTEPLAMVIDRLVSLTITRSVLAVAGDIGSESRELDIALSDLALGYDQLVADLLAGRRRQPRFAISRAI
ncbi:hypothetical protein [Nocardia sp. NPDC049149]|uniref:hypothetical protein n=1 Tax=Nocardia sp. NPDC049149 TaxID=3364315 RepID=UPI0037177138